MPKRPNPFGDSGPLQFKTHVGMKEMAKGSSHEELMKAVYERTHEKLFMAVNRNSDLNTNHTQGRIGPTVSPVEWASKFDPSQTLLDRVGHLVSPNMRWTNKLTTQPHLLAGESHNGHAPWGNGAEEAHMQCQSLGADSAMHCEEGVSCRQFNNWTDNGSTALGNTEQFNSWSDGGNTTVSNPTPIACMPPTSTSLGLDTNGQLRAPHECAMDCDADLQPSLMRPQSGLTLMAGGSGSGLADGVGVHDTSLLTGGGVKDKQNSRTGGGGVQGWGFLSAKRSASPRVNVQPGLCGTCHRSPGSVSCHFCEGGVCGGCCHQCDMCGHHFCQLCSTINYDTSVERAFCLSCIG